jgi:Ca2+/H+ antiporter, TMEM165/GDT1 family
MEEEYWTEKSRYNSPLFCIAPTLEAFFTSTLLVALAEIGDKTQLLSFVLAAKLRRPYPIMAGIFAATILNHALAASIGAWLSSLISPQALTWIVRTVIHRFRLVGAEARYTRRKSAHF